MKFNKTSLEYPATLAGFPPPLVQDGIWVWVWRGGKTISWGQEWRPELVPGQAPVVTRLVQRTD